ncbi:DDE-type integrase/transposase/recombinase [Rhizophagus irregularis DAOM 181602=DAOM 197198]|nr:DDE-type integrase/transposase/recombinase [Rhizophagus irregularis DAOM 181602=DAOM 197198]
MYHQADILYMPYDIVDRKLYKYCLNIVDVASRYKASVPLEDRSSARVAKAFKKIYGKADCPLIWPRVLQVDGGSEFKDEVIRLMDEKAERLFKIQDAKELLTEGVNTAWVKNLSDIVNELNNSNTRLLGMSPVEAIQKDQVYALPSKIRKDRPVGAEEMGFFGSPGFAIKVLRLSRVCDQGSSALFGSAVKVLRLSRVCDQSSSALFDSAVKVLRLF